MTINTWHNWTINDSEEFLNSEIKFHEPNPDASIVMHASGADEMIRVTPDGFWVRGVKVAQDDKEAETVYNAFKQWMAWAALTQRR
jgi:hypothetical protein